MKYRNAGDIFNYLLIFCKSVYYFVLLHFRFVKRIVLDFHSFQFEGFFRYQGLQHVMKTIACQQLNSVQPAAAADLSVFPFPCFARRCGRQSRAFSPFPPLPLTFLRASGNLMLFFEILQFLQVQVDIECEKIVLLSYFLNKFSIHL